MARSRCLTCLALWLAVAGAEPVAFTGVNLAGGEFFTPQPNVRPVYGRNFTYPTAAEVDYFAGLGMNVFRVCFRWETLQPQALGALDATEVTRLQGVIRTITAKGHVAVLDPHNYARYYGQVVGSPQLPVAAFADFWRRLAAAFAPDPRVWFGLINEPHGLPTKQWFEAAAAAVVAIREAGATNLILVPGNAFSGAHSWSANWYGGANASHVGLIQDPLDHWVIEVHQYLDSDSSGTEPEVKSADAGSRAVAGFVQWCRTNHRRAFLGEFGAPVTPTAKLAVADLLTALEGAPDVWLGWAWWAAGAWWGQYPMSLEPAAGQNKPQTAWLQPHLAGTRWPAYRLTVAGGSGTGSVRAAAAQEIVALPPAGQVFARWEGDVAWLANARAARTTLTMPYREAHLTARWQAAP